MILSTLPPGAQSRVVTELFQGYDHRLKIPDGAFYDTRNLSSRDYPLLATRPRRGLVDTLSDPGGLLGKDALCWVDNGTLYVNGLPTALTGLTPGEKQLVGMGAYVVVFPDKVFYNTEEPADFGSLEADWSITGTVSYAPCDLDGNVYALAAVSDAAPADPAGGDYWLDTGGGTLQQYSEAQGLWVQLETVYTRVSFPSQGQLPALFHEGDGVEITGLGYDALNGSKALQAVGGAAGTADDFVVLLGLVPGPTSGSATVRIQRKLPALDFVVECQNRLWGCFYGRAGGKTLNELYCSALGDFRNWRQYQGLSTDSWAASVGSDGPWTGAASYLGHPVFFKENRIHTVTVSPLGAHRVEETVCRGVQRGSHRSLCVVGETLYYKSGAEVCAWQGGFPQGVSAALGEERFSDAVGGAVDGLYYLSMRGEGGWKLFCCDTRRGVWYREDELQVSSFAAAGGELYALEAGTGRLYALKGTVGEPEETLPWMAETGILPYDTPDKKYLSRYTLSLRMAEGASLTIYLRYDSSGDWVESGTLALAGTGTVTVPIRPRRCDHLQLRLVGEGEARIYALGRILEVGSDA